MRKSLAALLLLTMSGLAQVQVDLREGCPDRHTVVRGDTLWDISGKFPCQSWKWPEPRHVSPQIQNPHLIYPGDTLSLVYADGQLRLAPNHGESRGTIKLSPEIRSMPVVEAIPTIPLDEINSFLLANCIVGGEKTFTSASYIVASNAERIVSGTGDRIYAHGESADGQPAYGIFRQGKAYIDPKTKETLGVDADDIGGGKVMTTEGDVATLALARITQEMRLGDRLFPTEEHAVNFTLIPGEPSHEVKGETIDVPRGVTQIGQFDVVTLNRGQRSGLAGGNVLAIYKVGETMRNCVTGGSVKTLDECAGLLMAFRAYKKLSYTLVLMVSKPFSATGGVQNPRLETLILAGTSRFWRKEVSYDGFQDQSQTLSLFLSAMDLPATDELR